MELPEESTGGDFEPIPNGMYAAVCTRFIDCGTQQVEYKNEKKQQHQVMLFWEIPEVRVTINGEDAPAMISRRFTWSMHKKSSLRAFLESWRGVAFKPADMGKGGFDAKNLVGAPAMLNIVQNESNGKIYSNINAITRMVKGLEKPDPEGDLIYIALQPDRFDQAAFEKLSERMRERIKLSPEYFDLIDPTGSNREPPYEGEGDVVDDEIPF